MPSPSPRRALAILTNGVRIGVAFQDAYGRRQIWAVSYGDRFKVYEAIRDLGPSVVILESHAGYMDVMEAIRAICVVRRIPIVLHSHIRAIPQRPYAQRYLLQTRGGANAGATQDEIGALAHLLTYLEETARDRTARALR